MGESRTTRPPLFQLCDEGGFLELSDSFNYEKH